MRVQELQMEKEAEAREKKKEIKKRDAAIKRLEKIENHLLQKLSEQVQVERDIIQEVSHIKDTISLQQRYNGLSKQDLLKLKEFNTIDGQ